MSDELNPAGLFFFFFSLFSFSLFHVPVVKVLTEIGFIPPHPHNGHRLMWARVFKMVRARGFVRVGSTGPGRRDHQAVSDRSICICADLRLAQHLVEIRRTRAIGR